MGSFCRFIFQQIGFDIDRGFVLIADDDWTARKIAMDLSDSFDAELITRWSVKSRHLLNYQMGVHLYSRSDRAEEWEDFLAQRDFFPIIIVGGIVPENLYGQGYVFRIQHRQISNNQCKAAYWELRKVIVDNTDAVVSNLKHSKTSERMKLYRRSDQFAMVMNYILCISVIWEFYWREKGEDESDVKAWASTFCALAESELKRSADYEGLYAVSQAVNSCVFDYAAKYKQLRIVDITTGISKNEFYKTILADDSAYFFKETLLKEICEPISNTVTFFQLKREMEAEGMTIGDASKGNHTSKRTIYDSDKQRASRQRFILIRKEYLVNDEGLSLEDFVALQNDEEEEE